MQALPAIVLLVQAFKAEDGADFVADEEANAETAEAETSDASAETAEANAETAEANEI